MVNRRRGSDGKARTYTEELRKKNLGRVREHLDSTLSVKEEIRFRKRHYLTIKKLAEELPLTQEEIESLMVIYYKFMKTDGISMTRHSFEDILHELFDITSHEMKTRISYVVDKSPTSYIGITNWVKAMAVFLRGSLEDQILHCFQVYDMMDQGVISKYQMTQLMQNCIMDDDSEEDVKDFLEMLSRKLDKDRDGIINFQDFKTSCTEQPLLMECFGDCLPTRKLRSVFLITFTPYTGKM